MKDKSKSSSKKAKKEKKEKKSSSKKRKASLVNNNTEEQTTKITTTTTTTTKTQKKKKTKVTTFAENGVHNKPIKITIEVAESSKKKKNKNDDNNNKEDLMYNRPIVAAFPSGIPKASATSFTWREQTTKSLSGLTPTVTQKIIEGSNMYCEYTSKSPKLPSHTNATTTTTNNNYKPLTKMYIGIFDKTTNKLTLHEPVENGYCFPMKQIVKKQFIMDASSSSENNNNNEVMNNLSNLTEAEKRRVLFESFGGAKKQKQLRAQDANKVNVDLVVGSGNNLLNAVQTQNNMSESNLKAIQEAKNDTNALLGNGVGVGVGVGSSGVPRVNRGAESAIQKQRQKFLPPFNAQAQLAHLVYDPERMCDQAAWGQISRYVDGCLFHKVGNNNNDDYDNDDDDEEATNLSWVSEITKRGDWIEPIVDVLKNIHDPLSGHNKPRIKAAVLMNHLVTFYLYFARARHHQVSENIETLAKRMRIPFDVAPCLFDTFTASMDRVSSSQQRQTNSSNSSSSKSYSERSVYCMNKTLMNKLLVHILLLYIIANGREMKVGDIRPLVKSLKLEISSAANLLRQAGCQINKKSNGMVAVSLKVPLKFPPAKMKR